MFFKKSKVEKTDNLHNKKSTSIEGTKSFDEFIAELDRGSSSLDALRVQPTTPAVRAPGGGIRQSAGQEVKSQSQVQPHVQVQAQAQSQVFDGLPVWSPSLIDKELLSGGAPASAMPVVDAPSSSSVSNDFDVEETHFAERFNRVRQNIEDRRFAETQMEFNPEVNNMVKDADVSKVPIQSAGVSQPNFATDLFGDDFGMPQSKPAAPSQTVMVQSQAAAQSYVDKASHPDVKTFDEILSMDSMSQSVSQSVSQQNQQPSMQSKPQPKSDFNFDEHTKSEYTEGRPNSVKFDLHDTGTGTCIKRQYPDPKFTEVLPKGISRDDQVIHTIYGDRALPVCSICGNRNKIGMWTREGFPVYEAWEMDKSLYSSEGVQVAVMCDECAQQHFEEVIDLSSRMQIKQMVGLADLNLLAKLLMMMYGSDFDDLQLDPAVLNDLSKSKVDLEDFDSYFDKDVPEVIRRVALLFAVDSVGFIATCDNAPVGFISAEFTQPIKTDIRYIGQVYAMWVCSTFRDLGVGHALVESLYAFTLNTAPVYHLTVNTNFVGMRNVESYLIDRYFEKTAAPSQFLFKELDLES